MNKEKQRLRIEIKKLKSNCPEELKQTKSEMIFSKLETEDYFFSANTVMAYWSLPDEVQTHDFIIRWSDSKQFILPVVSGDELEMRVFDGLHSMKSGSSFGILEPTGVVFKDIQKIDLIIVPGIAFDLSGNRLGRGKAYYDKFLKSSPAIKTGVCFDFQLVPNVPVSDHDIKMDYVLFA
jgi:5-formyltetrahydrofolate cyclo-ligase